MRARGAMPLMLPNAGARPVAGTFVVAAGGAGGVRAVAAPVARRVEFARQLRVDAGVAAPAGVVVARADQLLVAVRGVELLARRALAVPAGDLLVVQLAVLGALPLLPVRSEKLGCSGQIAAIDDADDDALALGAGRCPDAGRAGQSEEGRRG